MTVDASSTVEARTRKAFVDVVLAEEAAGTRKLRIGSDLSG